MSSQFITFVKNSGELRPKCDPIRPRASAENFPGGGDNGI